jgi:RimJ/RimL family protein N-acetyltransferase
LILAEPANADAIKSLIGDFMPDFPASIARAELYPVHEHGRPVALGIIAAGRLYPGVACIGMFVGATDRNRGLRAHTIRLLRSECARLGLEAVAGCAASNVASRATLERAGMVPTCRLLRIQLTA